MNVIVNSEIPEDHLDGSIDIEKWRDLAFRTLQAEGVQIGELNLIFVDSQVIEQLNETYLGKSEPTDVLAFPIDPFQISETDTPLLLGDVIICPEKAKENAKAQNKTFEEEIVYNEALFFAIAGAEIIMSAGLDYWTQKIKKEKTYL